MIERLKHDRRLHIALGIVSVVIFALIPIIIGYMQEPEHEAVLGVRQVQTDAEHCAITLPADWDWQVASSTATSPRGTVLGFSETFLGRPENPDWEEVYAEVKGRAASRDDVEVTHDEDRIRIDYGPDGGLSLLQRYDWIVCRLTFSGDVGIKAVELPVWEEIIASLVRTSPTGTPPEELPWRPSN